MAPMLILAVITQETRVPLFFPTQSGYQLGGEVPRTALCLSKAFHFIEEQSLVNQHGVTFTFPLPLLYKKVSNIAIATEPFLFKGS